MNKRKYLSLFALIFTSCFSSCISAKSLYYTFEGTCSDTYSGMTCSAETSGSVLGDTLSYIFMIDSEPAVHRISDSGNRYTAHSLQYNTELISGTGLIFDKK
jgi:hypothetical protein